MADKPEKVSAVKTASRLEQFHFRLKDGELKSIADWAMEFFDHDTLEWTNKVRSMMSALRRKGIMAYPVAEEEGKPKVVKIVNRNLTEFTTAYNRHASQVVEANILASFRIAEIFIREHPKAREMVIDRAKRLLEVAADSQKNLLGLSYGQSTKMLPAGKDEDEDEA